MSGILYPILILTLFLIVQILTMMASRKAVLDKNKQQLLDSVNASNKIYNNEELSILLAEQQEKIDALEEKQNNVLNKTYPVGSIYISYSNTNPASLFGGTWVNYGTGRTLVGVDTSNGNFNTVGKTGGASTHNHGGNTGSTTLTINQIPSHTHDFWMVYGSPVTANINNHGKILGGAEGTSWNTAFTQDERDIIKKTGGSQGHNHTISSVSNLQPYITVYMWRRTA